MAVNFASREFLLLCLRQALGESEEVYGEICDVCALRDISAEKIADGEFTVAAVAEQLFLTDNEAACLMAVCKEETRRHSGGIVCALEITADEMITVSPRADALPTSAPVPISCTNKSLLRVTEELDDCQVADSGVQPAMTRHTEVLTHKESAAMPVFCSSPKQSAKPAGPRYLRQTAASLQQTKKEREAAAQREVKPASKKADRNSSGSLRLSLTLLEPTAASRAKVATLKDCHDAFPTRRLSKSAGSQQLERILHSPSGQRVTRPAPFRLSTELRPKMVVLSTEEMAMARAKDEAFTPHRVPKHVYESRPLEIRAASSPKKPQDVFVPFHLASVERHAQQQKVLKEKAQARQAAEEQARQFSARHWSKDESETPTTPSKPEPQAATVPQAFTLKSEERAAHHQQVVDPIKKAKEAEQNKDKLEEERKARELMDMPLDDYRKTLSFKARHLPDFSSPFQPLSSPRSPTKPEGFGLKTTSRLGDARPLSAREDYQGHMGFGDAAFAGSLRRSVNPLSRSMNWPLTSKKLDSSLRCSLKDGLTRGLSAAARRVETSSGQCMAAYKQEAICHSARSPVSPRLMA